MHVMIHIENKNVKIDLYNSVIKFLNNFFKKIQHINYFPQENPLNSSIGISWNFQRKEKKREEVPSTDEEDSRARDYITKPTIRENNRIWYALNRLPPPSFAYLIFILFFSFI